MTQVSTPAAQPPSRWWTPPRSPSSGVSTAVSFTSVTRCENIRWPPASQMEDLHHACGITMCRYHCVIFSHVSLSCGSILWHYQSCVIIICHDQVSSSIMCHYHLLASCLIIIFHHHVSSSCIIITCHHHASSSCVIIMYHHHVSPSCLIIMCHQQSNKKCEASHGHSKVRWKLDYMHSSNQNTRELINARKTSKKQQR